MVRHNSVFFTLYSLRSCLTTYPNHHRLLGWWWAFARPPQARQWQLHVRPCYWSTPLWGKRIGHECIIWGDEQNPNPSHVILCSLFSCPRWAPGSSIEKHFPPSLRSHQDDLFIRKISGNWRIIQNGMRHKEVGKGLPFYCFFWMYSISTVGEEPPIWLTVHWGWVSWECTWEDLPLISTCYVDVEGNFATFGWQI